MSGAEEVAFHKLGEAQDRREQAIARGDTDAQILAARDCGEAHFAVGQYQLAKALLREAASLIDGTGRHRELLPGLIGLAGRASQRQKLWEQALQDYRRAAGVAVQLARSAEQLRWAGKEATTVLDMGESERGLQLLEASVELGRALPDDDAVDGVLSDLLARLAGELAESDPERAEKLWEETFERLDRIERGRFHFFAAVNYGTFLLFRRDKTYLARTHFEEALEIGHELGLGGEHLHDVVLRLSATLREQEPGRAGDLLLAELPTRTEPRARHELLAASVAHYYAGNLWSEMKAACSALRELREQGGTTMGRYDVEMSLSIACRGLGETDEALAALRRAREHAEELGDPALLTAVRGKTAIMHVDRSEFAPASQLAEELWEEGSRDRLTARTYVESLIALGDLDRARAIRDEFAAAGGEEVDVSWMSAKLADAGDGDPVTAWYAFGAAGRTLEVEAEALSRLHELYPPGSDDRYEAAQARLRLIERGRARVADVFSEESWLALTTHSRDFPAYLDDFVESACAADRHPEAIYELERFRSQMLVDVIANRAAGWSVDPSDRLEVKAMMTNQFHRARYRLQGLDALGAVWQSRREAAAEVDRLEAIALSAGGLIHFTPGFTGLTFPRDLDEHLAGSALGEGERLVFLHAGARRAHVWAMDGRGGVEHTVLPELTANRLEAMHAGLWRTSARGRMPFGSTRDLRPEAVAPEVESTLADLERLLTGPLVEWLAALGTQRAFLAAGTGVKSLPLDCSPAADAAEIEFSFLPSARLLGYARSPRVPSSFLFPAVDAASRAEAGAELMRSVRGRIRVLVDPTCSLRFAPVEAAMVAASLPDRDVEVLAPEAVTQDAAEQAARSAEILHVIGHGTFTDASPYRSGMYLGRTDGDKDDVWIVADVLTTIEAPAGRLAILSGCETGRVRPNIVSEEVSLPAAFLASGYAAVLGSRWAVDDLSTSLFMGNLYGRWLAGGVSIARAAAESKDWLRRLDRDTAADLIAALPPAPRASDRVDGGKSDYLDAVAALRAGPRRPFEAPEHWAAFYVAGDGAITADGIDPRVP